VQFVTHCLDLLFPPCCVACSQRLAVHSKSCFCGHCSQKINYLGSPVCRICGVQLDCRADSLPLCGECLKSPPPFSLARSVVRYESTVRDLLLRLKFDGDTSVLPGLKEIIANFDSRIFSDVDMVIPVPLYRVRLRFRGLNQAVALARIFFRNRSKQLRTGLLVRVRHTRPQSQLNGAERRQNLRNAFVVPSAKGVEGAVVCLVDDVYTLSIVIITIGIF